MQDDDALAVGRVVDLARRERPAYVVGHLIKEDRMTAATANNIARVKEAEAKVELAKNAPDRWRVVGGFACAVMIFAGMIAIIFGSLDIETKTVTVVVEEDQLSLAIGKEGQNVRLASRLTGYQIELVSSRELEQRQRLQEQLLMPIEEMVGVSDKMAEKLREAGIHTVQ